MSIIKIIKYFFCALTILSLVLACSSSNTGLVGHAYHNVTAKYNAYFIAREKLQEVYLEMEEAYEPNFNKTLLVFAPIDTNIVKADSAIIADIVKKASIAIQRHEVSKWVDDSYILVGKARFLNQEFEESIETFKYVNVKSENKQTQYSALINLIRTFIEYNEFNNAQAVIDYLSRKKLDKQNQVQFYLHAANFAQQINDPNNLIKYLNAASEIMPSGPERVKVHFILGQLFQKAGFDSFAYRNFESVIRNNPSYNYSFHARLHMAQVTELSDGADIKKIRKYFEQLLKDGKNKEFKDKIYYEMAEFELKQNNLQTALQYYKSSAKESVNNQRQKSFAYHKLGLIYFDQLNEYALAKAYYDSASKIMPVDEEIYPKVAKRQEVLSAFIQQVNTIHTNDSLLSLAKMDSVELDAIFTELRNERLAEEEAEAKRKKREARNKPSTTNNTGFATTSFNTVTNTSGKFYFYDPATVAAGKREFTRLWGNRSLQDNWRFESGQKTNTEVIAAENTVEEKPEVPAENQLSEVELVASEKAGFYSGIPFTEEKQLTLLAETEVAFYKLGNIYNFDLKEKEKAVNTYQELLNRYPETDYKAEILYLLYVYFKEKEPVKSQAYADQLVNNYSSTIFAKLVLNPNYQEESNLASAKVKALYETAYIAYTKEDFKEALKTIDNALSNYPENDYEDNVQLLKAIIIGKTEDRNAYLYQLQQFIKLYPESELLSFSKELLKAVEDYKQKLQELDEIRFIPYFDQAHYFVVLYKNNKALSGLLPDEIEGFAKKFYPNESLNAGNLIFNNEYSMILLSEFKEKKVAESFYRKFNSELSPLKDFKSLQFESFIISKDNFQIFYQSKIADSYETFFKENYSITP